MKNAMGVALDAVVLVGAIVSVVLASLSPLLHILALLYAIGGAIWIIEAHNHNWGRTP